VSQPARKYILLYAASRIGSGIFVWRDGMGCAKSTDHRGGDGYFIKNGVLEHYLGRSQHLSLPQGITAIDQFVFSSCNALESIVLPEGVTSIGEHAFSCCNALKEISLPNSLTSIGQCAFLNCIALEHITIPNGVAYIRLATFINCFSLKSVTIPESVVGIENGAFSHCDDLQTVIFKDPVGWRQNGESIADETLADPAAAAKLLRENHDTWTK
jgi:hypothetical protein